MERKLHYQDATAILEKLTGVAPRVDNLDADRFIIYWSDPLFADLALECSSYWTLDEHHDPYPPVLGIQSPEIIRAINLPGVREDAHILAGVHEKDDRYAGYFAVRPYLSHFLILQRCQFSNPDYYHNTSGWQEFYLPSMDPIVRQHASIDETAFKYVSQTHNGSYWELYIIPIGFRYPSGQEREPALDILKDVKEYIGEQRDRPIDLYSAAEKAQIEYFETAYHNNLAREQQNFQCLQEICENLNTRLAQVRARCSAYSQLNSFAIDYNRFKYGSSNVGGGSLYEVDDAINMVSRIERKCEQYQKFQPEFEKQRNRINNELYGELDTDNSHYVEVTLPKGEFGPQESGYVTKRFSYTDSGLSDFAKWLDNPGT